ncbi:hypothetical protein OJ996_09820 [Luteolibacter sp. GHJ8]|uniref:Uncharacterized protein n=1 Tax=Luteolibacter rhizosphaerae TaxID=2989719 RepID=A0ABT3G217_9BACT|nr:hypothetical protein [Luteolibacter rhizosphaerae]MCW1913872.1 hypothetical protein [Luteolibacter rhizosphaerae]
MYLLTVSHADAHRDTKLKIAGDQITGLPEQYSPCVILPDKNQLSIKGRVLELPKFLRGILSSKKSVNDAGDAVFEVGVPWLMSVSGSWNHDKSDEGSLPDYMIIEFHPEGKDYHFRVAVRLEDPVVVGTEVVLTTFSKSDGDTWVGSKKVSEGLSSTQMPLILGEASELDWNRGRKDASQ